MILRLTLGFLIFSHGFHKLTHGISGIKEILITRGFPEVLSYGIYIGEVIAPLCLIIGLKVRLSSLIMMFTMLMAIFLAHSHEVFKLTPFGSPKIELPLLYTLSLLALFLLGGGKFLSLDHHFSKRTKKIF